MSNKGVLGALATVAAIALLVLHLGYAFAQEEALLYAEDFESGTAEGWRLEPGWQVAQHDAGTGLVGRGHVWARLTNEAWEDYRFRFKVRLVPAGALHANLRLAGPSRYFIGLNRDRIYLNKQTGPDSFSGNLATAAGLGAGWQTIEIAGYGPTLSVSVNEQLVLEFTDPEPLTSGGIAFESLGESQVYIDDVEVWGPAPGPTPTAVAGAHWIRTGGPLGGLGYDVRMHPENPDIMYVTDAFAGVFKSLDGGATWFPSNNGITTRAGTSGDAIPIFCLTIDPNNPSIVWAGTQNLRGIFKSEDGGETWVEKTNGIVEREGITFRGITIDPRSSDIVYAAAELSSWAWSPDGRERVGREFDKTQGVVYKTTDGGETWTAIWRGDNLARYVWINPQAPDTLYVSTGIFDREAANSDHTTNTPGGVGVLKSTDGGRTWRPVNDGITNLYVGTLFMHPEDPNILLAGSSNNAFWDGAGVFLTTNGGESWKKVLPDGVQSVEISTLDPNVAYAGNPEFIYKSQDGGRTWQARADEEEMGWGAPGVEAGFPIDFQVDPRDSDRIFANNYGGGNFMSADGGATWINASDGYTGAQVRAIAASPESPGQVLAAARSGIFTSSDGGRTWLGLNHDQASGLEWNAVAVDPSDPSHLLAANNWHGLLFESRDQGHSWEIADIPRVDMQAYQVIAFAPSALKTVYAGTGAFFSAGVFDVNLPASGVFVSRNGGRTWEEANDELTEDAHITDLAVHPVEPRVVYAAAPNSGLFRTDDGGGSWIRLAGFPEKARPRAVAIHPSRQESIFVGVEFGGLYRSLDSGATWEPVAAGLPPEASITSIVFNPLDPDLMFFADLFSGVYRSNDGGVEWYRSNEGLRTRSVNALAFSSDGRHLYAATEGEGVYRLDLEGRAPESARPAAEVDPPATEEVPVEAAGEALDEPAGEAPGLPAVDLPCLGGLASLAFAATWMLHQRRR